MIVLTRLRDATRDHHAALDAAVDISTGEKYRRFMTASFAAISGLEPLVDAALARDGAERTAALGADLDELGIARPDPIAITLGSRDAAFGAAYVLEGSTLGGMVLAGRVEGFTTATRYLRLRGKGTAAHWKQFLESLERDVTDHEQCVDGARRAFDHYGAAFRTHGVLA